MAAVGDGTSAFKAVTGVDIINANASCEEGGTVAVKITASTSTMGGRQTGTARSRSPATRARTRRMTVASGR